MFFTHYCYQPPYQPQTTLIHNLTLPSLPFHPYLLRKEVLAGHSDLLSRGRGVETEHGVEALVGSSGGHGFLEGEEHRSREEQRGFSDSLFFIGNKLPHLATGLFWKVVGQRDCDDKWWLNDLGNNFGMWFI